MKKVIIIISLAFFLIIAWTVGLSNIKGEDKESKISYYRQLGQEQMELEAYGAAIQCYLKIIDLDNSIDNYLALADAYYKAGKVDSYKEVFELLMDLYSEDAVGYEKLATYYYNISDHQECVNIAMKAAKNGIRTELLDKYYYECAYAYWYVGDFYKEAYRFMDDFAIVKQNDRMEIVNSELKYLENIEYDFISYYSGDKFAVSDGSRAYFIDANGSKYLDSNKNYTKVFAINEGRGVAVLHDKYKYVNSVYQEIYGDYDYGTSYSNGIAAVKNKDTWFIIDMNGQKINNEIYHDILVDEDNFCSKKGLFFGQQNDQYYLYNTEGKKVVDIGFEDAEPFFEDTMTAVKINGKWGFINTEGEIVIEPQYDEARTFGNGLAAVKIDGGWGFINKSNKLVIDTVFQDAKCFSKNKIAVVMVSGNWRYIKILA